MRVFASCLASATAATALLGQQQSPPTAPPYFDEPQFIVAGVTDASQHGGHGSDPVLRSAESLAKETASLRTGSSPADAAERQGNALEAARQYQRAAELDPSEANLFNWGTELLTHRAAEQAGAVAVHRGPLRRRGAPLGQRNVLGERGERFSHHRRPARIGG